MPARRLSAFLAAAVAVAALGGAAPDARRRSARDRDRLDLAAHGPVGADRRGVARRAAARAGSRQRPRQLSAADGRQERAAAPRPRAHQAGVRGLAGQARSGARGRRAADHAGPRGRADRHVRVVDHRDGVAGRGALRHPVPQPGLVGAVAHRARPEMVLPRDAQRRDVRRQLLPVLRGLEEDEEDRRQARRDRRRGRLVRHRRERRRRTARQEARLRHRRRASRIPRRPPR